MIDQSFIDGKNEVLDELREYLDRVICNWREVRAANLNRADEHTASCYIDAFQSVRAFLFGETLPGGSCEDRIITEQLNWGQE